MGSLYIYSTVVYTVVKFHMNKWIILRTKVRSWYVVSLIFVSCRGLSSSYEHGSRRWIFPFPMLYCFAVLVYCFMFLPPVFVFLLLCHCRIYSPHCDGSAVSSLWKPELADGYTCCCFLLVYIFTSIIIIVVAKNRLTPFIASLKKYKQFL